MDALLIEGGERAIFIPQAREEDRCGNDCASIGLCGYLEKFIAVFLVMDAKDSNRCGKQPNVSCGRIGKPVYL